MEFGELVDVRLREAWPNEAVDFTPWLADNLERLARTIGLPSDIESEATEFPVEGFSADIVARIPADGSKVLIENQLESTDHTHLGQILTYLAGVEDVQTVIWVAAHFHTAHLAALRWLNAHTPDDFAFFGVQVRVVRIGEPPSPVAPLFEVVERPSQWEGYLPSASHTPNPGVEERGRLRQEFWQFYTQRFPADIQLRPSFRGSNVFHNVGEFTISQYLYAGGVGIYLRDADRSLGSEPTPAKNWYRGTIERLLDPEFQFALQVDIQDRDNWGQMADWLHQRLTVFKQVLETPLSPEVSEWLERDCCCEWCCNECTDEDHHCETCYCPNCSPFPATGTAGSAG